MSSPRRFYLQIAGHRVPAHNLLGLIGLASVAMLAFGMVLQYGVGLEPCPMCIVQRYALIGVAALGLAGWRVPAAWALKPVALLLALVASLGAYTAARQSWLQWYPPEVVSCGRDFYGMVENFPLSRAVPMIFKGSGDCAKVDWTFLGGSIANWSFLAFLAFALVGLLLAGLARRNT